MSFLLWITLAVVMVSAALATAALPAFVSFLALRGSQPGERPAILHALAHVTATLSRRSTPQRPDAPEPDQNADAGPAEQEDGPEDAEGREAA